MRAVIPTELGWGWEWNAGLWIPSPGFFKQLQAVLWSDDRYMTGTCQALGGEEAWMEHDIQNTQELWGLTILGLQIKKLFMPMPGQ